MDKYNWDLTRMYKDENEFRGAINRVNELLNEIVKYKGKLLASDESLLNALKISEEIDFNIERLYVYSHLKYYENMGNTTSQEYKEEVL
jgi:oligoendopeptidase F